MIFKFHDLTADSVIMMDLGAVSLMDTVESVLLITQDNFGKSAISCLQEEETEVCYKNDYLADEKLGEPIFRKELFKTHPPIVTPVLSQSSNKKKYDLVSTCYESAKIFGRLVF